MGTKEKTVACALGRHGLDGAGSGASMIAADGPEPRQTLAHRVGLLTTGYEIDPWGALPRLVRALELGLWCLSFSSHKVGPHGTYCLGHCEDELE